MIFLKFSPLYYSCQILILILNLQNVTAKSSLSVISPTSLNHCCLKNGMGRCSQGNLSFYSENLQLPKRLLMPFTGITQFRLRAPSKDKECKSVRGEQEISLQLSDESSENNGTDNMYEMKFSLDGFFKYGTDYFSPEEYCIKSLTKEDLTISLCLPDCDKLRPCITRCCEYGQVFDFSEDMKCVSSGDEKWSPTVYRTPTTKLSDVLTSSLKFHYISRHPRSWCEEEPIIYSLINFSYFEKSLFRILEDGSVVRKDSRRRWNTLTNGTYCIEGTQNIPGVQKLFTGDESQTIIFDCEVSKKPKKTSASIIYGAAQIISCIFLLMTVIVYVLLWDKQNIHGWTILGNVTSMFCFYLLLVTTYFYIYFYNEFLASSSSSSSMCKQLAIGTHFFFLSTFCWMTLINFDLYSTFKNLKPTAGNSKRKMRFFLYTLFAFGLPATIVAVGIILDFIYGDNIESEVIVPQYGKFKCFLDLEIAALPYLYGPIGFLLVCNLLFFTITMYSMYKIQQTTKIATNNSSQRLSQRNKQKSLLFLKIFLVMGVTWTSETITWAYFGDDTTHPVAIILDIINILQPIAIFIIFVCKVDIFNSLRVKYRLIDRTASSLSIDPLMANRIVHRYPKLERVIGPITRNGKDRRQRCMSTTTELTNLSMKQTSSSQTLTP